MRYNIKLFGRPFREWDITKNGLNEYGIVINAYSESAISPDNSMTEYHIKKLNISKWWIIRKIQLWAIKKVFK